jgi:hypothetical protein
VGLVTIWRLAPHGQDKGPERAIAPGPDDSLTQLAAGSVDALLLSLSKAETLRSSYATQDPV